jgi:hypothetical protein
MKITLGELHQSTPAFDSLATQKPQSAKVGYKLGRIVKSARDEVATLATAQNALLEKYGTPINGSGGQYEVPPENRKEFAATWNDLLTTEVEVWGDPFELSEIDGQLNLSIDEFARLGWLFRDSQ